MFWIASAPLKKLRSSDCSLQSLYIYRAERCGVRVSSGNCRCARKTFSRAGFRGVAFDLKLDAGHDVTTASGVYLLLTLCLEPLGCV